MMEGIRTCCYGLALALLAPALTLAQPAPGLTPDIRDPRIPAALPPGNLPGTATPVFPRLNAALKAPHQPVPVPPTLEIEVLDPNVDPRGNPAVLTRPFVTPTAAGIETRLAVDVPPTVLVHRYYYTGDRSFQGPLLPGGPAIVVVSHPRTGERLYLPVQMLPGAPRVTYTDSSIEYDYGTQAIIIHFGWLCGPKVTYRQGVPVAKQVGNVVTRTTDATRRLIDRTGIPQVNEKVVDLTVNVVQTTADRVNDVGKRLLAPPVQIIKMTPLCSLLTSSEEDRAAHARDTAVQRAQSEAQRGLESIKTNR
jgi:hypothetical protein